LLVGVLVLGIVVALGTFSDSVGNFFENLATKVSAAVK